MTQDAIFHKLCTYSFIDCFSISYSARRKPLPCSFIFHDTLQQESWIQQMELKVVLIMYVNYNWRACLSSLHWLLCKKEHLWKHGYCIPFAWGWKDWRQTSLSAENHFSSVSEKKTVRMIVTLKISLLSFQPFSQGPALDQAGLCLLKSIY